MNHELCDAGPANQLTPAAGADPSDEVSEDEPSALAVLIDDPIRPHIQQGVHEHCDAVTELHLDSEAGLEKMLDDILWNSTLTRIRSLLMRSLITFACVSIYGTTLDKRHRGNDIYGNKDISVDAKKAVRTESCVFVRVLQLLQTLLAFAIPWVIIIPQWMSREPISLFDLPDYELIKSRAYQSTFDYENREYEVLSSVMIQSWRRHGFALGCGYKRRTRKEAELCP